MQINEKLNFCKWKKWDKHNPVKQKWPGVYILAITKKDLTGQEPKYKDVCYIGMTNSKGGLKERLNQLEKSINGKRGHSGGNRIRDGFEDVEKLGLFKNWKKKLFVSYHFIKNCKVDKNKRTSKDLLLMGKCAYLEYKALSEYKTQNKEKEPKYNKK